MQTPSQEALPQAPAGAVSDPAVCYAQIGTDCGGQPIIPRCKTLTMHTNRHTTTDGNLWGWIEGCTLNICWSNDSERFNSSKAAELVRWHNAQS